MCCISLVVQCTKAAAIVSLAREAHCRDYIYCYCCCCWLACLQLSICDSWKHKHTQNEKNIYNVIWAAKAANSVVVMACNCKINRALTHVCRPHEHTNRTVLYIIHRFDHTTAAAAKRQLYVSLTVNRSITLNQFRFFDVCACV